MPTRKHRQRRERQMDTIDYMNAYRVASRAYHSGTISEENYLEVKAAWEEAKARKQEANRLLDEQRGLG